MINLTVTNEQQEIAASIAKAARKEFDPTELVHAAVTGSLPPFDDTRWKQIAALGVFSLGVPEDAGGLGRSLADEVLVLLELGKIPAPGPWIGTLLAARLAARAGRSDLAAGFVEGELRAGVLTGDYLVEADASDYGVRVDGEGGSLVQVAIRTAVEGFDEATPVARVDVSEQVLHVADPRLETQARLFAGAYLIGVAEAATDMAAEYAKIREQFGKPIGSFQAVKHRCSEMAIRAYSAKAQLFVASLLVSTDEEQAGMLEGTAAYLLALQAARRNSEDNIQNHGGIGVTAEHAAGVLVKRAFVYGSLFGSEDDVVPLLLSLPRTPFS
jgi:alkylation response protein AidB-like acyl-CoA dehydrogenase